MRLVAAACFVLLSGCGSDAPPSPSDGGSGAQSRNDPSQVPTDGGTADTGAGSDSGGTMTGTVCQQAATKLTSCGVSTGGIETDCSTRNACYASCMLPATCAELQGPTTDTNSYTTCLKGC